MSAKFQRRTELTPQQLEIVEKLNRWADRGTTLEFVILRNRKDGCSAAIDFGCWQVACDLRWLPQDDGKRKLRLIRTRRRRIYAYPAEPKELLEGEFDDSRQMFFTASLRQWPDGRYYFRLDSGIILLPIDQEVWQKADRKDDGNYGKIVGRRIELTGWARNTVYMVTPVYPDNVTYSQTVEVRSVIDQQAAMEQILQQRQFGIIPVMIEDQWVPISAASLLGIGIHETLTKGLITARWKAAVRLSAGALGSKAEEKMSVAGRLVDRSEVTRAAQEARKLLEELVAKGVRQVADLFPKVDGLPENGEAEAETIEIECTDCKEQPRGKMIVPLRDIVEGKTTVCPKCRATIRLVDGTTLVDSPGARDLFDLDDKQAKHLAGLATSVDELANMDPESIRLPHVITPLKAAAIIAKAKEAAGEN